MRYLIIPQLSVKQQRLNSSKERSFFTPVELALSRALAQVCVKLQRTLPSKSDEAYGFVLHSRGFVRHVMLQVRKGVWDI